MRVHGQGPVLNLKYDVLLALVASAVATVVVGITPHTTAEATYFFYYINVFVLAIVFRRPVAILFSVLLTFLAVDWFFVEPGSFATFGDWLKASQGFALISCFFALLVCVRQWMDRNAYRSDENQDRHLWEISHDLRSPIDAVTHVVESMRLVCNSPEITNDQKPKLILEMLDSLDINVFHQERLVESIMDSARVSEGKLKIRFSTVNVIKIIQILEGLFASTMQAKGLTFTVTMPSHPVYVSGDQQRLTRVLGNILSNAVKYTERGGVISINLTDHDQVGIIIKDSGIGIPPDKLGKIFSPGFQVNPTQEGLGFGLAVATRIVQAHRGSLSVSSHPGIGSEFCITLPKHTIAKKRVEA
jgi:signal transduction histidine kinase